MGLGSKKMLVEDRRRRREFKSCCWHSHLSPHSALHRVIYFYSVFFVLPCHSLQRQRAVMSHREMQRAALTKKWSSIINLSVDEIAAERVRESERHVCLLLASSSAVLTSRAAPLLVRRVQTVGWLTTAPMHFKMCANFAKRMGCVCLYSKLCAIIQCKKGKGGGGVCM